jgi:predicted RNase H-like HicB family nuclease
MPPPGLQRSIEAMRGDVGWLWKDPRRSADMRYVALLHQEPEANEIEVCFPDLPGCVTAGPTLAEARQLAGEALRGHLATFGRGRAADA